MTPELSALALAGLLQMVQLIIMAVAGNRELGTGKTLSPRDRDRLGGQLVDQVSTRTARLFRAYDNHIENLLLFALAVVVVSLAEANSGVTAFCAWLYLVARVLYVPAYAFGWVPWRSYIWATGFVATGVMIVAALLA